VVADVKKCVCYLLDTLCVICNLLKVPPTSSNKDQSKANLTAINVVMTHAVCDFDSLASAVGLAKVWSHLVSPSARRLELSSVSVTYVPTPS